MHKFLAKFILISYLILQFTQVFCATLSKTKDQTDYDYEDFGDGYNNKLKSLQCLPSGFPCTPTSAISKAEKYTTTLTTFPSTLPETTGTETTVMESTTPSSTTPPFPNKYGSLPSSCCSKCLYEEGWIDAVCA